MPEELLRLSPRSSDGEQRGYDSYGQSGRSEYRQGWIDHEREERHEREQRDEERERADHEQHIRERDAREAAQMRAAEEDAFYDQQQVAPEPCDPPMPYVPCGYCGEPTTNASGFCCLEHEEGRSLQ